MNLPFFRKFKLICLFAYWVKKTKKLDFQLAILLGLEVFITQLDFIAWNVALGLNIFIDSLFLKLLYVLEILLANSYQFLELRG